MAINDNDLSAIEDTAAKNAERGAKSVSIGDRRVDYQDTLSLLAAKRALANEDDGGIYETTFKPKGYF